MEEKRGTCHNKTFFPHQMESHKHRRVTNYSDQTLKSQKRFSLGPQGFRSEQTVAGGCFILGFFGLCADI